MAEWKDVLTADKFPGYLITEKSVPDVRNNCACPDIGGNSRLLPAILVSRISASDGHSAETAAGLEDTIRRMMIMLHTHGIECRGFADGGCGYCGICAGYETCRYPAMMIRPVSELYSDARIYPKTDFAESAPYGLIVLG